MDLFHLINFLILYYEKLFLLKNWMLWAKIVTKVARICFWQFVISTIYAPGAICMTCVGDYKKMVSLSTFFFQVILRGSTSNCACYIFYLLSLGIVIEKWVTFRMSFHQQAHGSSVEWLKICTHMQLKHMFLCCRGKHV